MNRSLVLALLLPFVCAACQVPSKHRIEFFAHEHLCATTAVEGAKTRMVNASALPSDLASLVPYAGMTITGGVPPAELAARLARRAEELHHPDLITYTDEGSIATGAVSAYVGWGITSTSTTRENVVRATALRLAPTATGIRIDRNGMVTAIREDLRPVGIQEGDTLVSIDGQAVELGDAWFNSPHLAVLLRGRPGQVVDCVWIRPGSGRMNGKVTLVESDRSRLDFLPPAPEKPPADPWSPQG
jgi:hypothetical protein